MQVDMASFTPSWLLLSSFSMYQETSQLALIIRVRGIPTRGQGGDLVKREGLHLNMGIKIGAGTRANAKFRVAS